MAVQSPLNEAQQRRLFSNAQQADKLLSDVEAILSASESKSIFPKFVADLSPPQVKLIRSYIARFRNQLSRAVSAGIKRPHFRRVCSQRRQPSARMRYPLYTSF
jgi:hypothetical protein